MNIDVNYLQEIADKTGGRFVIANDISQLPSMMAAAARLVDLGRNLISYRPRVRIPFLYSFLRIVFVTILGLVLTVTKAAVLDDTADLKLMCMISAAGSLLGGLFLELWQQTMPFAVIGRFLMVFLLGTTIVILEIKHNPGGGIGDLTRLR